MRREIHPLRMPRLVTAVLGRSKEPERVAVHETVPVEIMHIDEAPVILRDRDGREHRAWDGLAYAPFAFGAFEEAWEAAFERIGPFLRHQLKMGPYVSLDPIQRLTGWHKLLEGAERKRGFEAIETLRAREVHDDGKAAQVEAARFLAGRLAMVGDTLMVRTGLPRVRHAIYKYGDGVGVNAVDEAEMLEFDQGDVGRDFGCDDFRIDRPDEVAAYGALLAARLGAVVRPRKPTFQVVDGDALAACYERVAPEADLGSVGVANGVALAMRYELSAYPDAEIARYLELRRMAADADGAGIRAWMEGMEATRAAAARIPWRSQDADHEHRNCLVQMDRAMIRHAEIEAPKANMEAGDEAALMRL